MHSGLGVKWPITESKVLFSNPGCTELGLYDLHNPLDGHGGSDKIKPKKQSSRATRIVKVFEELVL